MTDTAKAASTCNKTVRIDSWHSARCTRAIKDEELCGIHLGAKRRREANAVKSRQKWNAEQERHEAAKVACEKVPGAMPHYGVYSGNGYDGRIVVPASIAYEYDALKAVEAVARRYEWQAYIPSDYSGAGTVCHACGGYAALGHKPDCELAEALAALDAIRKPPSGKTGEAVV